MLPDYEAHETLDYEAIAEELRWELFEKNNRLSHAESLLRKVREELALRSSWSTRLAALANEINDLLGD